MKPLLAHRSCYWPSEAGIDTMEPLLTQWNHYWHSPLLKSFISSSLIDIVELLLPQWHCYWHRGTVIDTMSLYRHNWTVMNTAEPLLARLSLFLEQWRHYWDCRTVILAQWSLFWQWVGSRFWHSGAVIGTVEPLLTQRSLYWHRGAVTSTEEISSAVWHTYPHRPCTPSPSPSARSP